MFEMDFAEADAINGMIKAVRPDGIVCANDFTAANLMHNLLKIGVGIPDDLPRDGRINADVRYAELSAGAANDAPPTLPAARGRGDVCDASEAGEPGRSCAGCAARLRLDRPAVLRDPQARISLMTLPATSVRRKSRPL